MTFEVAEELSEAPIAEMVESMARGIAEAQYQLDLVGVRIAQMMSGQVPSEDEEEGFEDTTVPFGRQRYSLLELGFTPSLYQVVETVIEIKVSVSLTRSTTNSKSNSNTVKTSSKVTNLSARYSAQYQYHAEGASSIRTRIVPIPPPSLLEERIQEYAASLKKSDSLL